MPADDSPLRSHGASPPELEARLEAERQGRPFLVYRDGGGNQQIRALESGDSPFTVERRPFSVGRQPSSDVYLGWDEQVSRLHAQIESVGEDWTLVDDGISRNGSFVNGERVAGRRRLHDGDTLRFGETLIAYRDPRDSGPSSTVVGGTTLTAADLSETQLRVLAALWRPAQSSPTPTALATAGEIAEELRMSVEEVEDHLRALFAKFGAEDLPQDEKRLASPSGQSRAGSSPRRGIERHPSGRGRPLVSTRRLGPQGRADGGRPHQQRRPADDHGQRRGQPDRRQRIAAPALAPEHRSERDGDDDLGDEDDGKGTRHGRALEGGHLADERDDGSGDDDCEPYRQPPPLALVEGLPEERVRHPAQRERQPGAHDDEDDLWRAPAQRVGHEGEEPEPSDHDAEHHGARLLPRLAGAEEHETDHADDDRRDREQLSAADVLAEESAADEDQRHEPEGQDRLHDRDRDGGERPGLKQPSAEDAQRSHEPDRSDDQVAKEAGVKRVLGGRSTGLERLERRPGAVEERGAQGPSYPQNLRTPHAAVR
jgi:pSer/pThr/pTyr-binding forkhead associated (FHA) protein